PNGKTAVRFGYARALAGASIDQTFPLEPSQIAGFNQSFRSVIPESVGGSDTGVGAKFESFGAALEHKVGSGTYFGVLGQILDSQEKRRLGAFRFDRSKSFFALPSDTPESRDYTEKTLALSLNQLVQNELSVGVGYR